MTQEKKADSQLTKMILFNIFQIFQINKIIFQQYLILHNHPDTFIHKCDAATQTDYTTIRPKSFSRNLSNKTRTLLEKEKLISCWPSDDNDSTDEELQKDPPEAILDQNSLYKTYTYIAFSVHRRSQVTLHTHTAHHQLSGTIDRPSTTRRLQQNPIATKIQQHSALETPNCRFRPLLKWSHHRSSEFRSQEDP